MFTNPPMDPTPPTRMSLEEAGKTPRRGFILGKRTGEVRRQLGLRMGEKENLGAVEKRKRSDPTRWREGREGKGRRSQELERGSKAKDWLWKEEVLWMPKRKSHGEEEEGGRELMIERQSLETVEKRTRDGIGRRDRIDSVTSVFRAFKFEDSGLVSDIFFILFISRRRKKKRL